MRTNPKVVELDPAEGSIGTARRILFPFYPAQVRVQEKAVNVTANSGQFTADEAEKSQFLQGNRRNLTEEGVVRKISFPRRVAGVPNLCNDQGQ